MADDRRSIYSIVARSGLLVGLLAVSTTAVTAQMQQTNPPDVEVPLETMVLVGVIAAVGAFIGAFLANWYWSRQPSSGRQAQQPARQGTARGQQPPPQQRQQANRQPNQPGQQSRRQQSGGRQPDDSQQSGP